jgi:hypothetical protein
MSGTDPDPSLGPRSPSLEEFLADHPDSLALLDLVRDELEAFGSTTRRMTRSQVAFVRRRPVAWAWAPGQHLRGRGAPLVLSMELRQRDRSARWKEIVEVRPGRFMHHLELWSASDLDADVRGWLRQAWEAAG